MLKKLIICYKLNKFYKIFKDVIGYNPGHIRMRDLSDYDCIMSAGFDIGEVLSEQESYNDPQPNAMTTWLNKLYKEIIL